MLVSYILLLSLFNIACPATINSPFQQNRMDENIIPYASAYHATQTHGTQRIPVREKRQLSPLKGNVDLADLGKEFYSTTVMNTAYVPKRNHYFKKAIPFQNVQAQISALEYALTELDPTVTSPHFEKISGQFNNLLKTKLTRSPAKTQ